MEKNNTNILSFEQLISFINEYYESNTPLVLEVVKKSLDVMIFTFGEYDTKETFINKVTKHYEFISGLEDTAEAPLFLTNEPKIQSEFSIKDITN